MNLVRQVRARQDRPGGVRVLVTVVIKPPERPPLRPAGDETTWVPTTATVLAQYQADGYKQPLEAAVLRWVSPGTYTPAPIRTRWQVASVPTPS